MKDSILLAAPFGLLLFLYIAEKKKPACGPESGGWLIHIENRSRRWNAAHGKNSVIAWPCQLLRRYKTGYFSSNCRVF